MSFQVNHVWWGDESAVTFWRLADEVVGGHVEDRGKVTHGVWPRSRAVLQNLDGSETEARALGQRGLGQQTLGAPVG